MFTSLTGTKRALLFDKALLCLANRLWNRIVDSAETVADFRSKQTDDGDHNQGDERENDRILDETLPPFLGCK